MLAHGTRPRVLLSGAPPANGDQEFLVFLETEDPESGRRVDIVLRAVRLTVRASSGATQATASAVSSP